MKSAVIAEDKNNGRLIENAEINGIAGPIKTPRTISRTIF